MKKLIPAFVLSYSNSDFTNPHEVVWPEEPADCTGDFTHMGAKYTGIETKRHVATKIEGNRLMYEHECCNWLKIGLKERAEISEIKISTKWFTGNQVRAISIILKDEMTGNETPALSMVTLEPDHDHLFSLSPTLATEALVNIYHEGGISRIHFHGEKSKEQLPVRENLLDTAHVSNVSNEHYGNPKMAIAGTRKENHMVGWESARTGYGEQAIFSLSDPSIIEEIVVDTYLHRLNPPLSCHIFGLNVQVSGELENQLAFLPKWGLRFLEGKEVVPKHFQQYMLEQRFLQENVSTPGKFEIFLQIPDGSSWQKVIPFEALYPDTYHRFSNFANSGPFTHLLYMHYPNGGIHGLKVFGKTQG